MASASRGNWVRELRVTGVRGEPACSATTIEDYTLSLGEGPVGWAVAAAREISSRTAALMPEFAPAEVTLRLGMEAAVLGVLKGVDAGKVVDTTLSPEAHQSAEDFVRRRVPLTSVWVSVRRGHARLVELLMRECAELVPGPEQPAALRLLSEVAFAFVDQLTEGLAETYNAENERWLATKLAMREESVRMVLKGGDVDLAHASECLRYEVGNRHHLAVLAWPEAEGAADAAGLQKAATAWLTAAGAQQALMVPQGRSLLWAWGNRRTAFPADVAETVAGPGFRVSLAVGPPGQGADGFRAGHRDALATRRALELAPGCVRPVTGFAAVELISLLTADREAAVRFIARELGELAGDDPHIADLRQTVRVYLESHSPQATATRLFVARNTVGYRLKRAEELLGRPLAHRQLELGVALTLAAALGEH